MLEASTANDGAHTVVLPNITTSTARIKVEAVGNYFFDINDANFSISPAVTPPVVHLGDGKGKFVSKPKSSSAVKTATGKSKFRFTADTTGLTPSGSASFKFKMGKVKFAGGTVTAASTSGKTLTMTVTGTNNGKAGFKLVLVAVDGPKDKIRIRMLKGTKVVYDSMPGKPASKKPKTKLTSGQITVV